MFHAPLVKRWRIRGGIGSVKRYIAFASRKADQLHANPLGRPNLSMRLPGGVTLTIELLRQSRQALITLIGGGTSGDYQFIGSADYLYRTYEDPDIAGRYLPLVYATLVTAREGKFSATPLYSSAESPPNSEWPYNPDPRSTDSYLTLTPAHQLDGSGVRFWYGESAPPYLMTQWQQEQPLHALGYYSGGSNIRTLKVDMGFDFGPNYFAPPGLAGVNKSPDSDWYQSACLHAASDPVHGDRSFIIMVDVNSVFYAYPVEGYGDTFVSAEYYAEKANVPLNLTQSQAAPFPAWVTEELKGQSAYNASVPYADHLSRLRPRWHFNRTGTRAACIAANRDNPWQDAYFTSEYRGNDGTLRHEVQEDYPGLVEVRLTISLTGPDLENFTFIVELEQAIYSKTDGITPVEVGYAQREMGGIPENALLMLEYRYYSDRPGCADFSLQPNHPSPPTLYDLIRPNLAAVAVVSYQGNGSWTEARRWLAYYGCYPTEINGYVEPRKFSPVITDFAEVAGGPSYHTNHFIYIAQLVALELDTLSFGVVCTTSTYGSVPKINGNTYGAEAVVARAIAFNEQVERKSAGHPLMVAAADDLYALTAAHPNLGTMTRIGTNATLDYAHYNPAWITDPNDDNKEIGYATMTVRDGYGGDWQALIQEPCENALIYQPFTNSGLFPDYDIIYLPRIFSFFDLWSIIRPGIRWKDSNGWVAGSLTFSDYPYAAVLHGDIAFLTLAPLNNVWHRIHTDRNGSYAFWLGPFAAKSAVVDFGPTGGQVSDTPDTYSQIILDSITIVRKSQRSSWTHLAAFNDAFGKTLAYADFFFSFQQQLYSDGALRPHFRPAASDPNPNDWYGTLGVVPVGSLLTGQDMAVGVLTNAWCAEPAIGLLEYIMGNMPTPAMEAVFLP